MCGQDEEYFKLRREVKTVVAEKSIIFGMKCSKRLILTMMGIGREF